MMTSTLEASSETPILARLSTRQWLILIIIISVGLRIGGALFLGNTVVDLPGTHDQLSYDMVARQIMAGNGMTTARDWWPGTPAGEPTAHWSYLYVWLLYGVYTVVGYQPIIPRLLQAILAGILMPWLLFRLGRRYAQSEAVGLAAGAISAVYLYYVYYAGALMTETFYIIGIFWTLDLAGELGEADDSGPYTFKARYLLLGVAMAMTVLLRQVFLLFLPFLFAWLLYRAYAHKAKSMFQMTAIISAAIIILALAIAPWTYRNYQVFDEFVLLNTNSGFAFFWGNHPIHGYVFVPILESTIYFNLIPDELRGLNEGQLDRELLKRGLGFIFEDPLRYISLCFTRIPEYFKFWPSPNSGLISNISRMGSFGIFLPLMLYGAWLGRRQLSMTSLLYLFAIVYSGVHIATWTLIRYRLPVDGVLLIFAGLAVVQIYAYYSTRTTPGVVDTNKDASMSHLSG